MLSAKPTCKMLVRLWNIKRGDWDLLQVTIPGKPSTGPADDYLEVVGAKVKPDVNGDFISSHYTDVEIDAVHSFASARLTIDLWEQILDKKIEWYWYPQNNGRLKLNLYRDSVGATFEYITKMIWFGRYGPNSRFTCKSFDIVCHETTHAIIDSMRFDLSKSNDFEVKATKESLSDLAPMLVKFRDPSIMDYIINQNDSFDIYEPNLLSEFAIGYSHKNHKGIRSALTYVKQPSNPHEQGTKLVYKFYQRLSQIRNFGYRSETSTEFNSLQKMIKNELQGL